MVVDGCHEEKAKTQLLPQGTSASTVVYLSSQASEKQVRVPRVRPVLR